MAKVSYNDPLNQSLKEPKWKSKPTDADYVDAKRLLRDFGIIEVDMPKFDNMAQLQRFTKNTINNYLEDRMI